MNPIVGDAWIGLFTSTNGGSSWNIGTLPGFPQDISSAGAASPLRGFEFTADGVVRAGSNGLFYVTGIAANRGDNTPSQIFVARYIDALTQVDPIELSEISIVDWDAGQRFLDKPWIAVGLPTSSRTYSVSDASGRIHDIPCGPVYVGYSVIHGKHTAVERTEIWLATSTDCGSTWTRRRIDDGTVVDDGGDRGSRESDKSDKSRKSGKRGGTDARRLNQGAVITVDHATGDAYVAWRRFKTAGVPDAILFVRCREGRFTCDQITRVGEGIVPFDQGSTAITMRTSAYPTMAVDGGGRVYLAWADRVGPEGDARIVMSTATPRGFGRLRWSAPVQVDPQADPLGRGHQLMPALAYANGQLALTYYSLQEDHLEAQLVCGGNDCSDALDLQEQLVARGDLAAGRDDKVFTQFLAETGPGPDGTFLTADDEPLLRRHTMDVRAVMFPAGALPAAFPAPVNVSRYTFGTTPYDDTIRQLQFNTPLIQLFANGTTPWMGDYQDVSALVAVPDSPPNTGGGSGGGSGKSSGKATSRRALRRGGGGQSSPGGWQPNTDPTQPPVFYAVWTDNRDVLPSSGYTPPQSVYTTVGCSPTDTGSRNQNPYFARIDGGLIVGSLANSKRLGTIALPDVGDVPFQRMYEFFVQNTTNQTRVFDLEIALPLPPGVTASFEQFVSRVALPEVAIPAGSTISRPLFMSGPLGGGLVRVNVFEQVAIPQLPLQGSIVFNPTWLVLGPS